ncbi:hypothetical protein BD770DRAFT_465420 [Pilaira anomala]|nr:hypothetical protein BD770DRAFT_465420 [Pilaira anomala]
MLRCYTQSSRRLWIVKSAQMKKKKTVHVLLDVCSNTDNQFKRIIDAVVEQDGPDMKRIIKQYCFGWCVLHDLMYHLKILATRFLQFNYARTNQFTNKCRAFSQLPSTTSIEEKPQLRNEKRIWKNGPKNSSTNIRRKIEK